MLDRMFRRMQKQICDTAELENDKSALEVAVELVQQRSVALDRAGSRRGDLAINEHEGHEGSGRDEEPALAS